MDSLRGIGLEQKEGNQFPQRGKYYLGSRGDGNFLEFPNPLFPKQAQHMAELASCGFYYPLS